MFDPKVFIEDKTKEIHRMVGDKKAVVALSGGVDSSVTTVLVSRALKLEQFRVFTIDDGLRREREPEQVVDIFKTKLSIPVEIVLVKEECFAILKGKISGEEKRTAYSEWFGTVCGNQAQNFGAEYAFFGGNALDFQETKRGAQRQHNVWEAMGIDPEERFSFKSIDPLKNLYKEEIRQVARTLGIPPEISERMPFPGPGLAIRIMGEVTQEKVDIIRKATAIVEEELMPLKPFQCLACLFSEKVTGIREDQGGEGYLIVVRCVDSLTSGRTAIPTKIPFELMMKITQRILDCDKRILRVAFDTTPKPPGRIEYE